MEHYVVNYLKQISSIFNLQVAKQIIQGRKNFFNFELLSITTHADFPNFFNNKFTIQNRKLTSIRNTEAAVYRDHITNSILEIRKDIKTIPENNCVFIGISHNVLLNSLIFTNRFNSQIWMVDKLDSRIIDGSNKTKYILQEFVKLNNVNWIEENIPTALQAIPNEVVLFHLDTVNPEAELSSLPTIFSKLSPTGIIILDTFFNCSTKIQRNTLRELVKKHSMVISIFPTMQIMITKS
jgi:hypothetical protein